MLSPHHYAPHAQRRWDRQIHAAYQKTRGGICHVAQPAIQLQPPESPLMTGLLYWLKVDPEALLICAQKDRMFPPEPEEAEPHKSCNWGESRPEWLRQEQG